jgi:hypothetical protein
MVRGVDAACLQELSDLLHFLDGKALLGVVDRNAMPAKLHADPCTPPIVDLGAEVGEKMLDILEADIGADRMREESVQNLAMMVIHGCS